MILYQVETVKELLIQKFVNIFKYPLIDTIMVHKRKTDTEYPIKYVHNSFGFECSAKTCTW